MTQIPYTIAPYTLAIETSGAPASVAVLRHDGADGDRSSILQFPGPRPDIGRRLVPGIAQLIESAGLAREGLQRIVVGAGPGSYTGLRIGIAAARSLAYASGSPIIAFPSSRARAAAVFNNHGDVQSPGDPAHSTIRGFERVAVALDALRGDFAFSLYSRGTAAPQELVAPCLVPADELKAFAGPTTVWITDRLDLLPAFAAGEFPVLTTEATAEWLIALDRAGSPPLATVDPIYLRVSAAEEKMKDHPAPPGIR